MSNQGHLHPYRIGRFRVNLDRTSEHPSNPNSQTALEGDELEKQLLKRDLGYWCSFYQDKFNTEAYELKGIIKLASGAPSDAASQLRKSSSQSGGAATLPSWVKTVQIVNGLHRRHCAKLMDIQFLEFECFTIGQSPLCPGVADSTD